jgi:glutamate racemase
MSTHPARPRIGVFDSGVGGLTVLRALTRYVPNADYLYFGDTARLPYGTKSRETVAKYAIQAARYLESQHIEMLVVGCNTASALALYDMQGAVSIPVVGVIEPGADAASQVSKSREAVVFATEATISSHAYQRALARRGFVTHEKACTLLVPLIEEGWVNHEVTEQVARIYTIEALRVASINTDVLVLGCTHYPLIRELLRRIVPQKIQIVDSADSVAQAVARELGPAASVRGPQEPTFRFFLTDASDRFKRIAPLFLGFEATDVNWVDLGP